MADRIRFHLDEHIHPAVARALRRHGIDLTTTIEASLRSAPDVEHVEFARREHRIVVTHDADFLKLLSAHPAHPGVAYCAPRSRSISQMIRTLILMWEILLPEDMLGRVEYL